MKSSTFINRKSEQKPTATKQIDEALNVVRKEIERIRKGDVSIQELKRMYVDPLPPQFESLRPFLNIQVLDNNTKNSNYSSSSSSSSSKDGNRIHSNDPIARLFEQFVSRDSSRILEKYLNTMSSRINEASFKKAVKQHITFENVKEMISNGKITNRKDLWKFLALICNNVLVLDSSSKESEAAMDLMGWGRPLILGENGVEKEDIKKRTHKKRKRQQREEEEEEYVQEEEDEEEEDSEDSTQTSSSPTPQKAKTTTISKRSSRRKRSTSSKKSSSSNESTVRKSRRARKPKNYE
jgi:hypothetical protein